jgi:hypothetical protein
VSEEGLITAVTEFVKDREREIEYRRKVVGPKLAHPVTRKRDGHPPADLSPETEAGNNPSAAAEALEHEGRSEFSEA